MVRLGMSSVYFLYAIRSKYSTAMKVGYYLGDIVSLRGRYTTPFGRSMDITVFQLADKAAARKAETTVHRELQKAGHHLECELFSSEGMKVFMRVASELCQDHVGRQTLSRSAKKALAVMEARRAKRRAAAAAATSAAIQMDKRRAEALSEFLKTDCTINEGLNVNAGLFRRALCQKTACDIRQKDLKPAMANRGLPYKLLRKSGLVEKVFYGLQLKK